jgi:hypothetical protein
MGFLDADRKPFDGARTYSVRLVKWQAANHSGPSVTDYISNVLMRKNDPNMTFVGFPGTARMY